MAKKIELQVLLKDIITKYIINYLDSSNPDVRIVGGEIENSFSNESEAILITPVNEIMRDVKPKRIHNAYAIDGSSRSFISSKGIISLASLVLTSSMNPIVGVYPPISGLPSLDLERPFIAIAPAGSAQGPLIPFFYSSEYITTFSLDGSFFTSAESPEEIETEIRTVLETEALRKINDESTIILIDGPLIPPLIFLKSKVRDEIVKVRLRALKRNVIGIVKRLDKSKLLISTLAKSRLKIIEKFRIDPKKYFNDESFILDLIKYNISPPYTPIYLGPILRYVNNIPIYTNYLIYPFHPYTFKFSILRIESTHNNEDILGNICSLQFTKDGLPSILGLSDKMAKEISGAILKIIMNTLESMGLQASFYSRLEQVGI